MTRRALLALALAATGVLKPIHGDAFHDDSAYLQDLFERGLRR